MPSIVILNLIILIAAIWSTSKLKQRAKRMIWIAAIGLTLVSTISSYPQEFNLHVTNQVWYGISAIQDYENITPENLELQHSSQDTAIKNASDRYVVALYKFKDQLLLDGNYNLYQRESNYFMDRSIRSIDEIPVKLTGYHKVMWWYLTNFKS